MYHHHHDSFGVFNYKFSTFANKTNTFLVLLVLFNSYLYCVKRLTSVSTLHNAFCQLNHAINAKHTHTYINTYTFKHCQFQNMSPEWLNEWMIVLTFLWKRFKCGFIAKGDGRFGKSRGKCQRNWKTILNFFNIWLYLNRLRNYWEKGRSFSVAG